MSNSPSIQASAGGPSQAIGLVLEGMGVLTRQRLVEAGINNSLETLSAGDLETLVQQGKLPKAAWGKALAQIHGKQYLDLSQTQPDTKLIGSFDEAFLKEREVIPVSSEGGRLVVAMVNPTNRALIDELTYMTGMRVQVAVITPIDFRSAAKRYISAASAQVDLVGELDERSLATLAEAAQDDKPVDSQDLSNPIVRMVNQLLEKAILQNASDIHIEPRGNRYVVRFRVDGILRLVVNVPPKAQGALVSRVKIMSRMDIAETRKPQDGRMTYQLSNTEYNLRVNTLPIGTNREKIVIRILHPAKKINDFSSLGFSKKEILKMEKLYNAPYGIVLVCGPTGSGKSTTLYTVMHKLNQEHRNISTVEDPIELTIEGLNQSQVNPKANYTFATSIRALMRQDPDVLMVGEIRDYETLEAAIHAALTGHMVFSTIHANTSVATISRMVEMGASPSLISHTLNGVVAQRLVRRLCTHCREPYAATEEELNLLLPTNFRPMEEVRLFKGKGCDYCGKTGYAGRIGVYEIMTMNRDIRRVIADGQPDLVVEDTALRSGMKPLEQMAREKVLSGETSMDELYRVFGSNLGGHD